MLLALQGIKQQSNESLRPFFTYSNGVPAIWDIDKSICLRVINHPRSLTTYTLRQIRDDFRELTGIAIESGCQKANVVLQFDSRSRLKYLSSTSAVGAAVALLKDPNSSEIVGGLIQIDEHAYALDSQKTRSNLILHELGHVIGLAHSNDGGLMMPALSEINHSTYPKAAILEISARSRLLP